MPDAASPSDHDEDALPDDAAAAALVVGLGASAGGIEALRTLLATLPPEPGFALVLQQHAGEGEQDLLIEVLARLTDLPVRAVQEGGWPEENALHVVPPNAVVALRDGQFRLRPPRTGTERRNPIDRLFQSLADACGMRAVGVVLSGSGTDGALGLSAIGAAGGMTMAQAPETAAFSDMPNAVAAAADHTLPPVELARTLLAYSAHFRAVTRGAGFRDRRREIQLRLPEICDVLVRRTAHDFKHYKNTTLIRRIERRMQVRAIDNVDSYIAELARDMQEPHVLFRDLLIGVTSFFREPEAFSALGERVLAALVTDRSPHDTVRIWVPGCATGEEAYTIAMLVREQLDGIDNPPKVQIFATDVNERSLMTARRGSYPQGIASQLTPERLARFFAKKGRRYQVTDEIRELCLFSVHNLISDPPFSRLDLISCRNLLIYLGSHLQKKLIPVFHYALRSGGHLLLGASESLTGHGELFRVIDAKHRIAQRKDSPIPVPGQLREFGSGGLPGWRAGGGGGEVDLGAVAQRILLDEFTPRYVIVTEEGQVVFLSEGADLFIQAPAGSFSNNIMRMVRRGMSVGLRTALHQSIRTRRIVAREIPAVHTAEGPRSVRLTVQPMPELGREDGLYMLVFQDLGAATRRMEENGTGSHPDADAVIESLERELLRTREDLERTVQDLEAANEEMKSSNEELLSMNEELQSANEELETSKEEVQAANQALAAANADLENLLRSTRIATVFLDGQGAIRSFTPAASEIYNITPSDVGRPLAHFTNRLLDMPPIPEAAVLESGGVDEAEGRTEDGRWFLRRALPYRAPDGRTGGVVVTFVDLTNQKASEEAFRRSEETLRIALEAARLGAWERDLVTGALTATPICKTNLGLGPDDELTFELLQSLRHPDDRERVNTAIRAAIQDGGDYDVEYRVTRPDGAIGWLLARGHVVKDGTGRPVRMIGVTLDVTDRKRADMVLAQSSERLRLALQASRMGDWTWDAASDAVSFSPRAIDIFGIDPTRPITWTGLRDLLNPGDRDRVAAAVESALATADQYTAEYRVRRPADGREVWVEANGQTTRGADGRVSGLIGVVQDVSDRKHVEERQTLLIRELHHRVKNTLATVQAIVGSTARSAGTIDEFYQGFVGRIVSLAKTHNLLTEDYWQTAALNEMLANELGPYDDEHGRRVVLEGPQVELTSEIAVPIGMAIHELTTNAIKYGALLAPAGRVVVSWRVEEAEGRRLLRFAWREENGPPVAPPKRQGFGSRLLQRVLATQLQAKVEVDFAPGGLVFTMDAPLPDRPAGPDLSMPGERPEPRA